MDGGVWWATVLGVPNSQTWLSNLATATTTPRDYVSVFFCLIQSLFFIIAISLIPQYLPLPLHVREDVTEGLTFYAHRGCQMAGGFGFSMKRSLYLAGRPHQLAYSGVLAWSAWRFQVYLQYFLDPKQEGSSVVSNENGKYLPMPFFGSVCFFFLFFF